MTSDDGWGPVEQGGGTAPSSAPPRVPDASEPPDARGGFGPVQRGRGRRLLRRNPLVEAPPPGRPSVDRPPAERRGISGRRVGLTLLAAVVVLAAAVAGTAAALALYASTQINRIDVDGLGQAAGQMNVLVIGNDSREGLSDEELQALGTEAVDGDRTDTIFLLSVSGGRAAMLSFPRDLFVTRCDGSRGRINVAYALGGPTCMAQTVTQLSGIPVTHYAEVNFLGFISLVDAVGGVSMYFDEPFVDRPAGVDLPAGCQRLDGAEAIGYVRARTVDDDLGRIARQQRFLGELADEILRPSTLVNPVRLFRTAGAAGRAVTASRNLGTVDLLRLARAGRGFAGAGLATYTVPASPDSIGGAAVLVPDEAAADALFAQFRDGSILDPPPAADAPPADGPVPEPAEPAPPPAAGVPDAGAGPGDC